MKSIKTNIVALHTDYTSFVVNVGVSSISPNGDPRDRIRAG